MPTFFKANHKCTGEAYKCVLSILTHNAVSLDLRCRLLNPINNFAIRAVSRSSCSVIYSRDVDTVYHYHSSLFFVRTAALPQQYASAACCSGACAKGHSQRYIFSSQSSCHRRTADGQFPAYMLEFQSDSSFREFVLSIALFSPFLNVFGW